MRPKVAILVLCFALALSAQATPHSSPTTPRLFDEFGAVAHCDLGARVDNFAIALMDSPDMTGYIVAYGPKVEGASAAKSNLELIKDYLVNSRGFSKRRIKTAYGGRNQDLKAPRIQLWIIPQGIDIPEPEKFETDIETFKGLFNENEIEEEYLDLVYPEEMGPGIGFSLSAAFADMLNQQKKAIAYIVAYNGENAVPGAARRIASEQLDALKSYKVDPKRVKTIFGGVRKKTTLQLWILPPDDPAPATDAGSEEPLRKNVKIANLGHMQIAHPDNQRVVFNRMLEVLRVQPALKAYVMVTLESEEPQTSPELDSGEIVDLPMLLQKWRDELTKTHKIQSDRFIVVFTVAPPDEGGNYFDLWIVPPGQPFPDPNDEEKDDETDYAIYENLPPSVTSTMGYRLGALIRGN